MLKNKALAPLLSLCLTVVFFFSFHGSVFAASEGCYLNPEETFCKTYTVKVNTTGHFVDITFYNYYGYDTKVQVRDWKNGKIIYTRYSTSADDDFNVLLYKVYSEYQVILTCLASASCYAYGRIDNK
ncbi:hypothetical protein [Thermoflavimicrobium dichotomicum]|uniref:Secreted protein n=1 Tax=Thermoflavimicrobium dichotomicum TaxID=46223 RepID=A0A1I3T648_9BACL|nr:hypothetical protein [Thermoflavimicrobium dichotomicum]SFJ66618.1 hypothetical protein SAMN05421852_11631 [Thermoflavimicrobium dichotomicum]